MASTHETVQTVDTDEQIAAELAARYPTAATVTSDPAFRRALRHIGRTELELQCYLLHLQSIDGERTAERIRREVRRLFARLGIADDDRRLFVAVDDDARGSMFEEVSP